MPVIAVQAPLFGSRPGSLFWWKTGVVLTKTMTFRLQANGNFPLNHEYGKKGDFDSSLIPHLRLTIAVKLFKKQVSWLDLKYTHDELLTIVI